MSVMRHPRPVDLDRGRGTEPTWKEVAQTDPWRIEITKKIVAAEFKSIICGARLKPVSLLQPAFETAKEFHQSQNKLARTSSQSKFQIHNVDFLLTAQNPRLRVSLGSVDRALRLLNFILHHCHGYGIEAWVDKEKFINVSYGESSVRLSINERFEEVYIPPPPVSRRKQNISGQRIKQGTGELSFTVSWVGHTRRIVENSGNSLESQVVNIFAKIVLSLAETKAFADDFNQRIALSTSKWLERAAEAAHAKNLTEQLETMRVANLARNDELRVEAAEWEKAASIRRYVDHVRTKSESSTKPVDPNLAAWICWAMGVAESLDPTDQRVSGLPPQPPAIDLE